MTRLVINTNDIIHNYNELARQTHALVVPTLKADCYGLGALRVMELLSDCCGVSVVAVSRLEEALPLAGRGTDVLLLSCYHDDASIKAAVDAGLIMAVDSLGQAKRIAAYALEKGTTARVHVKIDTGFGRFGFMPDNLSDIKAVYKLSGLRVGGIFTHFSESFNLKSKATDLQLEKFSELTDRLRDSGIDVGVRHAANSCAALRGEKYRLDAVRVGSALLGRLPMKTDADLRRVGRFETEIIDIRTLKRGSNIGYGGVFSLKRDTRVAVLAAGSADGVLITKGYDTYRFADILRYGFHVFKMLFSDNRLELSINGRKTRAVGRVALTHTMADVTDIDCKCGDRAVIDISPLHVSPKVLREYENV